jgi:hypothetical protein
MRFLIMFLLFVDFYSSGYFARALLAISNRMEVHFLWFEEGNHARIDVFSWCLCDLPLLSSWLCFGLL